jgi:hypothetical protein
MPLAVEPRAMPALAAEAGREAARAPPGPARLTARYWTDGGALEAKTAQARRAATATTGWARARYSTAADSTRPSVTRTMARAAFASASRPPRNEPAMLAMPYATRIVLASGPERPVTCSSNGIR